jgi:hypothetical protein
MSAAEVASPVIRTGFESAARGQIWLESATSGDKVQGKRSSKERKASDSGRSAMSTRRSRGMGSLRCRSTSFVVSGRGQTWSRGRKIFSQRCGRFGLSGEFAPHIVTVLFSVLSPWTSYGDGPFGKSPSGVRNRATDPAVSLISAAVSLIGDRQQVRFRRFDFAGGVRATREFAASVLHAQNNDLPKRRRHGSIHHLPAP